MNLRRFIQSLMQRDVDLVTTGSLSPYIRPYVEREVVWIAERYGVSAPYGRRDQLTDRCRCRNTILRYHQ